MRSPSYVVDDSMIPTLALRVITQCGIEGIRNAGGRWQRCDDEVRLQKRVEKLLRQLLSEEITEGNSPNTPTVCD